MFHLISATARAGGKVKRHLQPGQHQLSPVGTLHSRPIEGVHFTGHGRLRGVRTPK